MYTVEQEVEHMVAMIKELSTREEAKKPHAFNIGDTDQGRDLEECRGASRLPQREIPAA